MKANDKTSASDFKFGRNIMTCVALLSSMVWGCAVDSMSAFEIILYACPCVFFWWVVKELNTKYEIAKREEKAMK